MSDGLRTWILSTLGGWLVALLLVYLGERGLLPPPPAASLLRPPDDEQPRGIAARPIATSLPDDALAAASPTVGPPDDPTPMPAPGLVVAEAAGVNLRAQPSMRAAVIAVLPRGTVIAPEPDDPADEAEDLGWQHVDWNGHAGWVARRMLQPAAPGP